MARIERTIQAVECTMCGQLHELVYMPNHGAVGGGHLYLCRGQLRSRAPSDPPAKTVTLGLEL
jgi:hypothetical protein